ncbi:TPA: tRNA (adenosine(37)-N6)-threonylcarbamoyltransferase complex dimerization subunit type 1 TsaB [Candidatus Poribacteria bacterium]|nr:tRNA (adenosine(37)-N6)-threonylcarbamoyltransferase complex dimerization subunit type 1 TsaB [Candidatus Poribacteria bacterium]
MIVLGIETATMTGGLALIDEEKLISEYTLNMKTTHSSRLMPALDWILKDASLDKNQINGIAISIGPGSFTGLRIGLATAKGLAMGLNIPLVTVPTLDALANNATYSPYQICPVLDARKKEVYFAFYRYADNILMRESSYQVISPDKLIDQINEKTIMLGDGLNIYGELFKEKLGDLAIFVSNSQRLPKASVIAELGLSKLKAGEIADLASSEPLYIRRADAEIKAR